MFFFYFLGVKSSSQVQVKIKHRSILILIFILKVWKKQRFHVPKRSHSFFGKYFVNRRIFVWVYQSKWFLNSIYFISLSSVVFLNLQHTNLWIKNVDNFYPDDKPSLCFTGRNGIQKEVLLIIKIWFFVRLALSKWLYPFHYLFF